tara:strand:- start:42895 stop:44157 length:1263 start_codon:yes stop_codon:yes gene_type:complete
LAKKKLEFVDLVFFGIGAIVGTGIFVIPSLAASLADSASFWVWLELGMLTIFMALCFAEFSSVYPRAGGLHQFVNETFGRFAGFMSGWIAWLISWFTISSLAVAFSYYISYFIPLSDAMIPMVAIGILILTTIINMRGMHWGLTTQYILTSASILVLWFFVTWGVYWIDVSNYVPKTTITITSMFAAAVFVIEPFIGWETITFFASDSENPTRDVPRAIIYSSVFVTILYSAVIFVTLGLLTSGQLSESISPLADAANVFLNPWGGWIVGLGAVAILLGCINSWIVSTGRLPASLAHEGYFPTFLGKINKKTGVPTRGLLSQLFFASIAVYFAGFEALIYVLVSLAMMLYLILFIAIPFHRRLGKEIPFKIPLNPLVPIISIIVSLFVLVNVERLYLMIALGLVLVGVFVYFTSLKFIKR